MAKEYYQLIRSFGGLSLEYASISESDFAGPAGASYVPPERGDLRRITGSREIQLLSDAPGVIESFQTSDSGDIFFPANTFADNTNDAGNGRVFFIKNSGTTDLAIKDYLGTSLMVLTPSNSTLVFGNNLNTWDFLEYSITISKDNANPVYGVETINFGNNIAVTDDGGGTVTVVASTGSPIANLTATTTNSEGSANSLARSDHSHAITVGAASTQTPDQANAEGTSSNLSRSDHVHNLPTAIASDISSANAQGSATSFSRSDHIHKGVHSIKALAGGTQRFGDVILEQGSGITLVDSPPGTVTFNATVEGKPRYVAQCGRDGAQGVGKYLQFFRGISSSTSPFVVPENSEIKALSVSVKTNTTATFTIYKNGTTTIVDTLSLIGTKTAVKTGITHSLSAGDTLTVKVSAGTVDETNFSIFLTVV